MRFAARRICENCARAQSARTEFHAVRVDRADCDDVGTKAAIALEGIDVQKDADVGGLMPEKLRHQLAAVAAGADKCGTARAAIK